MSVHDLPNPTWLNEDYVQKIIENTLPEPCQVLVSEINITPASKVGENFSFQVLRIDAKYSINNQPQQLSIIGKIASNNTNFDAIREDFDISHIECLFFQSTCAKFTKQTPEVLKCVPKGFYVDSEKKSMFMEDLIASKFQAMRRGEFLDKNHCILAVEALACFHAASYLAVKDEPELVKEYEFSFWEGTMNSFMELFVKNAQEGLENNVASYGIPEKQAKKLLNFYEDVKNNIEVGTLINYLIIKRIELGSFGPKAVRCNCKTKAALYTSIASSCLRRLVSIPILL